MEISEINRCFFIKGTSVYFTKNHFSFYCKKRIENIPELLTSFLIVNLYLFYFKKKRPIFTVTKS